MSICCLGSRRESPPAFSPLYLPHEIEGLPEIERAVTGLVVGVGSCLSTGAAADQVGADLIGAHRRVVTVYYPPLQH